MDQRGHVTKFLQDNFFNLRNTSENFKDAKEDNKERLSISF